MNKNAKYFTDSPGEVLFSDKLLSIFNLLGGKSPFENLMKATKCASAHNFTTSIRWLTDPMKPTHWTPTKVPYLKDSGIYEKHFWSLD